MKLAIDIFGADNSPAAQIDGCIDFLKEAKLDNLQLLLVGDESIIEQHILQAGVVQPLREHITIVHASEVVTCHDSPTAAMRQKKDSSMMRAISLVAQGDADAVVSGGNTGALLTGATFVIKRISGVKRPALGACLPTITGGKTLLMDSGANADCRPEYLAQFAIMGAEYMRAMYSVTSPRIALISNGAEDEKGNELVRAANAALRSMPVNFVGNIEGRDPLFGVADVCVCDGFTGNILLKTLEGSISMFSTVLKQEITSSFKSKMGGLLLKPKLKSFKSRFDYRQEGGAPLLGVNSVVIKAHGSSDACAFKNAVKQACKLVECRVTENIVSAVSAVESPEDE